MKKSLTLLLLVSLVTATTHADEVYPDTGLSPASQNQIITSTVVGALVADAGYGLFKVMDSNWRDMSPAWVAAWALIGGSIAGLIQKQFVPESYLSWADDEMDEISHNKVLTIVLQENNRVSALKKHYAQDAYPLSKSFKALKSVTNTLREIKSAYEQVRKSHLHNARKYCTQQIEKLKGALDECAEVMKQVKEDSNFLAEVNAQHLEQMAIAQQQAAIAQQQAATAALINAYNPPVTYVYHV